MDVPTLVMGVDVTHPTSYEERSGMPSVASVRIPCPCPLVSFPEDGVLGGGQPGSLADDLRSECEGAEEMPGIGSLPIGCSSGKTRPVLQDHSTEAHQNYRLQRWSLGGTVHGGLSFKYNAPE